MWCSRCVQTLQRRSISTASQKLRLSRYCDRFCPSVRNLSISRNVLYERRHDETRDINVKDVHTLPPTHGLHASPIGGPPLQNTQLVETYRLEALRNEDGEQNNLPSQQPEHSGLKSVQYQQQEDIDDNQEDVLDETDLSNTSETREHVEGPAEKEQHEASDNEIVESYDEYSINPETLVSEGDVSEDVAAEEADRLELTMPVIEADKSSTATVVRPQSTEESVQPSVYSLKVTQDTVISMVQMLRDLRKQGLPNELSMPANVEKESVPGEKESSRGLRKTNPKERELAYQKQKSNPRYLNMLTDRSKLPINQESVKRQIVSLLEQNDVLVLVSETGSGKSTQLPQLILEHEFENSRGHKCNILCTQPRRLAATSVARRVADEQAVSLGPYSHVGYSIRFKNLPPDMGGSISYWTAGVLLKDLHETPHETFSNYSTIIIDEVHERDLVTDLCLTMLRDLIWANKLAKKPYPKVVLMSATLDAIRFKNYFEEQHDENSLTVASLNVPGRNYAVESHMLDDIIYDITSEPIQDRRANTMLRGNEKLLDEEDGFTEHWESLKKEMKTQGNEDIDSIRNARARLQELNSDSGATQIGSADDHVPLSLLALTIAHLLRSTDSGDILVFLPGMFEIGATLTTLQNQDLMGIDFNNTEKVKIFRLHSSLYETNDEVFQPLPVGCRRVILATNIAQTSITLPDVIHVIDCGKHRQMSFRPEMGYNLFRTVWADQSTCAQRRGRAGRTRPGHYWALYTQARYESLQESITPGIKLADLATATLTVSNHLRNMSPRPFLQRMLDSPEPAAVDDAIQQLQKLQMLTKDEMITSLGRFAVSLPLPPATSRSLLISTLFRCLEPLLVIACHNPDKPLIYSPISSYNALVSNASFSDHQDDDRFAFVKAFQQYDAAVRANNRAEIRDLQGRSVTSSPHREMVNVGHQVYSTLASYGVVPAARNLYDVDKSVFPDMPAAFNQNSKDDNLVKAVALTTMHTNMAVWDESAKHWLTARTKFFLRPYSINSKTGLKALGRTDHQRREGEIMAYTYGLKTIGSTIPMLVETSSVTPLMAILFGGPVESVSDGVIQIDGWLRYAVKVERDQDNPTSLSDVQAANLILEMRKALDRYLAMAFSDLSRHNYLSTNSQGKKRISYNPKFTSNPIRTTITEGIAQILKLDTRYWNGSYNSIKKPAKEARL